MDPKRVTMWIELAPGLIIGGGDKGFGFMKVDPEAQAQGKIKAPEQRKELPPDWWKDD